MIFNKKSGFTLIEVLIAAVILIIAGVAGILVEKNYIQSSSLNKHKLQATLLAQDGINLTRSIFNDNLMKGETGDAIWTNVGGLIVDPADIYTLQKNGDWHLETGITQEIVQDEVTFTREIYLEGPTD